MQLEKKRGSGQRRYCGRLWLLEPQSCETAAQHNPKASLRRPTRSLNPALVNTRGGKSEAAPGCLGCCLHHRQMTSSATVAVVPLLFCGNFGSRWQAPSGYQPPRKQISAANEPQQQFIMGKTVCLWGRWEKL